MRAAACFQLTGLEALLEPGQTALHLSCALAPFDKEVSFLGDATSSLGDAKSSLGDAKSSLGDAKSSLGGR